MTEAPKLPSEVKDFIKQANLDQLRAMIGCMLSKNLNSGRLWDIITAQRGPDTPSETINCPGAPGQPEIYKQRRDRKYLTTEVIRSASWFGVVGGAARSHSGTTVTVRPLKEQDHFDRHVIKAANALGLEVKTQETVNDNAK